MRAADIPYRYGSLHILEKFLGDIGDRAASEVGAVDVFASNCARQSIEYGNNPKTLPPVADPFLVYQSDFRIGPSGYDSPGRTVRICADMINITGGRHRFLIRIHDIILNDRVAGSRSIQRASQRH